MPSALEGGFPTQVIGSFTNPTVGRASTNPQFQNPTSFGPKLNYSMVKGRHTLKVGYEFLAIRTEVLDVNPLYGQLTYSGAIQQAHCGAVRCNCTSTERTAPTLTISRISISVSPAQSDWAPTS